MLDITDPLGIGQIITAYKLDKWAKLVMSCAISAFVCFWGTLGTSGGIMLAATHQPVLSLVTGFLAACVIMAAGVLKTAMASPEYKSLSIQIPDDLKQIELGSDITKPPGGA